MHLGESSSVDSKPRKRATWLGVLGGTLVILGASTLLVGAAILGGRIWAASAGAQQSWTENMAGSISPGWFLLQGINIVSSMLAGWVLAWLSPPRSIVAPTIFFLLVLAAAGFAQLPPTRTPVLLALWALGAPLGVAGGVALQWRRERQA
jgi:hypothetical protein